MDTPRKKYKPRAKKPTMSSVVSVRITEKEKEDIDVVMKNLNIKRYSDFMRIALQMVQPDMSYSQVHIP